MKYMSSNLPFPWRFYPATCATCLYVFHRSCFFYNLTSWPSRLTYEINPDPNFKGNSMWQGMMDTP